MRVVIADDNLLMREGIAALVRRAGIEVVGEAGDADELLRAVAEQVPDAVIVDVRMPPTHTDEGLRAAQAIRAAPPADGHRDPLADRRGGHGAADPGRAPDGLGYLLKDRVTDYEDFAAHACAGSPPAAARSTRRWSISCWRRRPTAGGWPR